MLNAEMLVADPLVAVAPMCEAPVSETLALRRGVIAIILRPEIGQDGEYTGKHLFYCFDHNGYQHGDRRVKEGIGLMSETFEPGEEDTTWALARSYVEEILGRIARPNDPDDDFAAVVAGVRKDIIMNLRTVGTFEHYFNYGNPEEYFRTPDTQGSVLVMVDDNCVLPVGDIDGSEEVHYAGYLSRGDLNHPYINFRSGYNTRYLLGSSEVTFILKCAGIEIAP